MTQLPPLYRKCIKDQIHEILDTLAVGIDGQYQTHLAVAGGQWLCADPLVSLKPGDDLTHLYGLCGVNDRALARVVAFGERSSAFSDLFQPDATVTPPGIDSPGLSQGIAGARGG